APGRDVKQPMLLKELERLHHYHINNCPPYARIAHVLQHGAFNKVEDIPFLPVSAFKNFELKSIPDDKVYKTLTSSGTTGSVPSKIFLDAETARNQTLALAKIMQFVLGKQRLPMLIVDSDALLKNRQMFSARGAGVVGMSTFGKDHFYMLDENMQVKESGLKEFLNKYNGQKILIFGFTFMLWLHLYQQEFAGKIDLSNAILIHSGGWKKLVEQSVTNEIFKQKLHEKFGLQHSYNFYGMVEQVGSVFVECEHGFLHTPNFADVVTRRAEDFSAAAFGEEGLLQVVSILPESYPGHSLLTEDLGVIHGEDDCRCGRKGKYFSVKGRVKKAELRGCSDTYAVSVA
ncbi:MAG TPA: hypothetical protein VG603_10965, partial [Chitinophagales bacterium]|nr:hypothetical protein [Chitinophagales bacterium]